MFSRHSEDAAQDIDGDGGSSLERSLSPLWKFTYYSGLLLDWSRPMRSGCLSIVIHCITIPLFFSSMIYYSVNMIFQVVQAVTNPERSSLYEVMLPLVSWSNFPLIFLAWATYLLQRTKLLAFFRDWNRLEKQHIIDNESIKRFCIIVYGLYFILGGIFSINFMIFYIALSMEAKYEMITLSYPEIRNSFLSGFRHLIIINIFTSVTFLCLVDIVPILVYYHASKVIQTLEWEFKSIPQAASVLPSFNKELAIHRIWSDFEHLRVMVSRANGLFGPTVMLNHGVAFFIICGSLFLTLNSLKKWENTDTILPILLACLVFFPSRLLFSILLMSKVSGSSDHLLSTVALYSTSKWLSMEKKERKTVHGFLNRIQHVKLAACPSGFYRITHSILLTLLSLIVSYTVIFIQSN